MNALKQEAQENRNLSDTITTMRVSLNRFRRDAASKIASLESALQESNSNDADLKESAAARKRITELEEVGFAAGSIDAR